MLGHGQCRDHRSRRALHVDGRVRTLRWLRPNCVENPTYSGSLRQPAYATLTNSVVYRDGVPQPTADTAPLAGAGDPTWTPAVHLA